MVTESVHGDAEENGEDLQKDGNSDQPGSENEPEEEFQHLASDVERVIEEHVRVIKTQDKSVCVYLERLRPKFRHYEIQNETQQIFSHLEVQTYQQ